MIGLKKVSFEDVTQLVIDYLPVCCIMNVRDFVNEWVREDDNNSYIYVYRKF